MRVLSAILYVCLGAAAQTNSSAYNALINPARAELKQANYSAAIPLLRSAQEEAESRSDNIDVAATLSDLGEAYRGLGRYSEAESALKKSVTLLRPESSPRHLATVLMNLGTLYRENGNYARAIV